MSPRERVVLGCRRLNHCSNVWLMIFGNLRLRSTLRIFSDAHLAGADRFKTLASGASGPGARELRRWMFATKRDRSGTECV